MIVYESGKALDLLRHEVFEDLLHVSHECGVTRQNEEDILTIDLYL